MLDASQILDGTLPSIGAAITTTRVSTNTIDWLAARDMGNAFPLGINVRVITAFVGGTDLTVSYEVGATAGGTFYGLLQTMVLPAAQLIAGKAIFRTALPPNQALNSTAGVNAAPGRYARLKYTVTGTFTAGTVFAYIAPIEDRNMYTTYANNYTVYVDPDEI